LVDGICIQKRPDEEQKFFVYSDVLMAGLAAEQPVVNHEALYLDWRRNHLLPEVAKQCSLTLSTL